jgi:hypothetical protein
MMGGWWSFQIATSAFRQDSVKYFGSEDKVSAFGVGVGWMEAIAALLDAGNLGGDHGWGDEKSVQ